MPLPKLSLGQHQMLFGSSLFFSGNALDCARKAFEETRSPLFAFDQFYLVSFDPSRRDARELLDTVMKTLEVVSEDYLLTTTKQGKFGNPLKRMRQARVDFLRFVRVEEHVLQGMTRKTACVEVSVLSEGLPIEGNESTIHDSDFRVRKAIDAGSYWYKFGMPLTPPMRALVVSLGKKHLGAGADFEGLVQIETSLHGQ